MDLLIYFGSNSSYLVFWDDGVFLEGFLEDFDVLSIVLLYEEDKKDNKKEEVDKFFVEMVFDL